LDANAENLTIEETAKEINDRDSKLTNIVVYGQHPSASTQLMTGVGELCREIKSLDSSRRIILTGLHPSALPERTLREEACDFVCEGEGFYTLLGLAEHQPLKSIPGLWWKKNKDVFHTQRAKTIENLTKELGTVAWDLLPLKDSKYRAHNHQCLGDFESRKNYASISTSLGCPFKCDFCAINKTFGERRIRTWEPSWVVNQIETLVEKYDVKVIKIIDEMFIFNPKHYVDIANGLIEKGLGNKLNIWAYARVDTIKEDNLKTLRKAGFRWLCLGYESGNEEILKTVHKGNFTRQKMIDINNKIQGAGINVLGNYMFGFPQDNLQTMQETLDLAMEQNCEFVNFYCATAWPGSKLYDEVIQQGIKVPESWENYAQHARGFVPLPTNSLSAKQVLEFRDNAFNRYFASHKYLNMIEEKFGIGSRRHIESMNQLKLKRKLLEK
jgi:radical SAM superfamily enzyme YgiQ (UPF0313 family)